jgi:Fibronectin type III domain
VLDADLPGKPGVPQLSDIKKGTITVTWTPPEDDGGAPITGYYLEYRSEGMMSWKKASEKTISDTKYVAKGLSESELYEFRVAAVNKVGTGPYSDNSTLPFSEFNLTSCFYMWLQDFTVPCDVKLALFHIRKSFLKFEYLSITESSIV